VRIVLAVLLLGLQACMTAQAVQLTSDMANADSADVRTDASGNVHLVFTADDATDGRAVFYRMLDANGNVLIDTTRIDDGATGGPAAFPSIAIDAVAQVYVVWQSGASPEIYFMRIAPMLDDRDGSAADPAVIKVAGDLLISGAGGDNAVHPRIAIDANTRLHVVWENECAGSVQYAALDSDGVLLNGPVSLGGTGSCHDQPDVALDADGNVHVVFANAGGTVAEEIWYAMLDGSTGAILIDATLLSADDGLLAGSATISVNRFDGRVFVVAKEETGTGGNGSEVIVMSVLDPALDDQDGSAGDVGVMRIDRQQLALGNGLFRWQVFARIGSDRRVHILYTDVDENTCAAGPYTVNHAHVIYDGRILVQEIVSDTATALACSVQARLAANGNRLVWSDSSSGSQEIHSITFSRVDSGDRGFTCSLRGTGGGPAQAGDAWLVLLAIIALADRRRRRREA